jgi:hypothetical protein
MNLIRAYKQTQLLLPPSYRAGGRGGLLHQHKTYTAGLSFLTSSRP